MPGIGLTFSLIVLCHSGYAGMIAIGLVTLFVCNGIITHRRRRGALVLVAVVAGYAATGLWFVPSLIGQAQNVTTQRMSLIDGSSLGSTGAYLASDSGNPVAITQGAGWQSATTASNIRQLNAAAEQGDFPYLFDRRSNWATTRFS